MSEKDVSALRLTSMGFVYQQYNLIPVLNVIDNVALPLISQGAQMSVAHKAAKAALEDVMLSDKLRPCRMNCQEDKLSGLQLPVLLSIILASATDRVIRMKDGRVEDTGH